MCALTYGAKKRSDSPHGLIIHLNYDHNESKDCIMSSPKSTNSASVPDNWSLYHQVKKQPQQQCGKASTFGRDFNLVVWQFWIRSPNSITPTLLIIMFTMKHHEVMYPLCL